MTFKKHRFYFDVDEATFLRLQALLGKSHFQQKDFQAIVNALITKTFDSTNGKSIK